MNRFVTTCLQICNTLYAFLGVYTYTIQARGWLIIRMKDNKTIEIVFLKNESRTMIIFVSESQSQNMIDLGRSLPTGYAFLAMARIILNVS